jgi:hypothetical protein
MKDLIKQIKTCPNIIHIDSYLPDNISIESFENKGWGLVTNKKIKKNDIVYICPINIFPDNIFPDNNEIKFVSKKLGDKILNKNIHLFNLTRELGIFPYYDTMLNHDNNSNAFHDVDLLIYKNNVFITLIASKDIEPGEEITINYLYECDNLYLIRSFLYFILPSFNNALTYDHINKGFFESQLDKVIILLSN